MVIGKATFKGHEGLLYYGKLNRQQSRYFIFNNYFQGAVPLDIYRSELSNKYGYNYSYAFPETFNPYTNPDDYDVVIINSEIIEIW